MQMTILVRAFRFLIAAVLAAAFAAPSHAIPAPARVEICHWDAATGTAAVITVSAMAVPAHFARHGDSYPGSYHVDADRDGYGDPALTDRCPSAGLIADGTDCDDTQASINPGAAEIQDNGFNENCSGCADDSSATCVCYTVEEVDAAYAAFPYAVCDDQAASPLDYTNLTFTDGAGMHGFMADSWAPHAITDVYCENYAHNPEYWYSAFLTEAAEAECERVLQDWAVCHDLECN